MAAARCHAFRSWTYGTDGSTRCLWIEQFARTYLGIDTGWAFATGAPAGLVKDPWNIRLVPDYWLGVFFFLAHLAAEAGVVLMAHGVRKVHADRTWSAALL
jgi:hypothetical protein